MPRLTVSKVATFRTCPRLYYYEHVLYLERVTVDGRRPFGTLYHAGLEAWWKAAGAGDAPWSDIDAALVAAIHAIGDKAKHADTDPFDVARAESMMIGYHARWATDLEYQLEGGGTESWFEVPLVDPDGRQVPGWMLVGRKDAIARFNGALLRVVEHKHTSSDIAAGSRYWDRLGMDLQVGAYIDSARMLTGEQVEVLYDVTRTPDIDGPQRATPEADREYTKGKGCTKCGGSGGGKKGIVKGAGCGDCKGTGWKNPPRLVARQNDVDETVDEYRARVTDAIAANPDGHYRQVTVRRSAEELAETRADMVACAGEIDTMTRTARSMPVKMNGLDSGMAGPPSPDRRAFPRNTNACLSMYGRRCDFYEVCSGQQSATSDLYRIRPRRTGGTVSP